MEDVQNSPAPVALPIDRVGVKGLKLPLLVRDRAQGTQHTLEKSVMRMLKMITESR